MLRLFVGIDLPPEVKAEARALGKGIPAAHWSHVPQLHLTLRFMGDTPEESLPALQAALREVRAGAFTLRLSRVGVFPARRRPARVLWAGITPEEPVIALKTAIDARLGPDPEAAARPYAPHLTLARFRDDPEPALGRYLADHATFSGSPFRVDSFQLYRSTLARQGPIHDLVESYPLASP